MTAILFRNVRLLDPSARLDRPGDLLVRDGLIAALGEAPAEQARGARVVDGGGRLVVAPGFIDLHTHLREPGQEDKETIATGTAAAARSGFTTVCAMPNTTPTVDNAAVVEWVVRKAAIEGIVRVLPIGAVTKRREGRELAEMGDMAAAGAVAFSDDGNPVLDPQVMRLALSYARAFGLPIIDHCEDPRLSAGGVMHEGWVATRLGVRGLPPASEEEMVARDIALAEATGGHVHIAHVSTARSAALVADAKARGLRVTAEVSPQALTLTHEWLAGFRAGAESGVLVGAAPGAAPHGRPLPVNAYDTNAKLYPPLRTADDTAALAQALADGVIDAVATDHAPHEWTQKTVTLDEAAFGMSVLETSFGMLMALVHAGRISLPALVERLTAGPGRVLGGRLADFVTLRAGTPADLAVLDPDRVWTVDVERFASKGRNNPLHGISLRGQVAMTLVGGKVVWEA